MSANLWSGGADPDAFAQLVDGLGVDVVAVQEVDADQAHALNEVLPHGSLGPGSFEDGIGIAMRRPGKVHTVEMPWRQARATVLDPADWPELGVPIQVTAMHLMAPQLLIPRPSFALRPKQLRALEQHLGAAPSTQRVVLGDFNATPLWPAYRRMASQLTDAAVTVADAAGVVPRRTWGPWSGAPRLLRIDHAFVSGVDVETFRVVDVPGSDHSAIVMDVAAAGRSAADERAGAVEVARAGAGAGATGVASAADGDVS